MMLFFARKVGLLCAGALCALILFSLLLNLLKPATSDQNIESIAPITITVSPAAIQAPSPTATQETTVRAQPTAPPAPAPPSVSALSLSANPVDIMAPPGTDVMLASLPNLPALAPAFNQQTAPDPDTVPIYSVPPKYPKEAERKGIEGWVEVRFTITKNGTVDNIEIVKVSHPGYFEKATIAALKHYRFRPREVNGKAVSRPAALFMRFSP